MKKLFLFLLCLGVSTSAYAQFNTFFLNFTPLTHGCDGSGGPISHGYFATIYWDQNNNGADPSDQPVPVGPLSFQANFNSIDMGTGEDLLGIPGGFANETAFQIISPPQPLRFFFVVEGNSVRWTSAVFTIPNGINELEITGWTCEELVVPCDEPTEVTVEIPSIYEGPIYQCISVCADQITTIRVGPAIGSRKNPIAIILPGCDLGMNGCDNNDCPPATFSWDGASWVLNEQTNYWESQVSAATDGCICFCFEEWRSVSGLSMQAIAYDRAVDILWTSLVETEMSHYVLQRRQLGGEFSDVATVNATNSTTTTEYSFRDENLTNGTAYEYTLSMVDVFDNTSESGLIVTATPSVNSAIITDYALHQNYPNPFNSVTNFVFDVVEQNNVSLKIYNVNGELVAQPVNGQYSTGRHTISYDASSLATGLYFYTLKIGNEFSATNKMLLIK